VEFAPEASRQAGNKAVNRGEAGVSEIAKTSLIDLSLASSIAKLYGSTGFRVVPEVFSGRNDPKVWFGYIAHNLMHYSGFKTSRGEISPSLQHSQHTPGRQWSAAFLPG
jgi:hypothetical protein